MFYSNYSFCVFDDWIINKIIKVAKANKSDKNKAKKRIWRFTTKLSNSLFLLFSENHQFALVVISDIKKYSCLSLRKGRCYSNTKNKKYL